MIVVIEADPAWRPLLIGAGTLVGILLTRRPGNLGCRRQVPQDWSRHLPASLRFFLWGMLLGAMVTTVIPYSAFILLFAAQLSGGMTLAAASGALAGASREAVSLAPALLEPRRWEPERLMALITQMRPVMRHLNTALILASAPVLLLTGLRL